MAASPAVEELAPSELGTKEYWSAAYRREGEVFAETEDPGEVWFGEEAAARMVTWVADRPEEVRQGATVLDVGCGNGMLSCDLAREGFLVTGVDYCHESIDLARRVAELEGVEVKFEVVNILDCLENTECEPLKVTYDVIVDKGTFDAISLGETAVEDKLSYVRNMAGLLQPRGILLITSCNWTGPELELQFGSHFSMLEQLPTPSFTFGGVQGNTVVAVAFRKLPGHNMS
jgi:2-polyprenyl-3-methyl-5-hydroxy-6-metoxy-1,4-benzoquinol methylase